MYYRATVVNATLRRRVVIEIADKPTPLDAALAVLALMPIFQVFDTEITIEQISEAKTFVFDNGALTKEMPRDRS